MVSHCLQIVGSVSLDLHIIKESSLTPSFTISIGHAVPDGLPRLMPSGFGETSS